MKKASTSRMLGGLLIALALACGQKSKDQEPEEKNNATAATPTPAPTEPSPPDLFAQIPDTAFLAFYLGRPVESIARTKALLEKLGLPTNSPELEEMKAEFGIDIFDPGFLKKVGIDDTRGIAAVLDTGPLLHIETPGFGQKSRTAFYLVVPLSDPVAFEAWMRDAIKKDNSEIRLEDDPVKEDRKIIYHYRPVEGGEWLEGAMVIQKDLLYLFVSSLDHPDPPPATPKEAVAAYQRELETFFARVSSPLAKDALFTATRAKTEAESDAFFYMNLSKAVPFFSDGPEEFASAQLFTDLFPAVAASLRLEPDRATLKGVLPASPTVQPKLDKLLVPDTAPPSYATLFPEDTGLFYRLSLNPLALKDIFLELQPPEQKPMVEAGLRTISTAIHTRVGLDLEKDILGGLSGHFAFGAPSLEQILAFGLAPKRKESILTDTSGKIVATKTQDLPLPKPPPVTFLAQTTSAGAGKKLIGAIEKGLGLLGVSPRVEEVDGQKIYVVEKPGEEMRITFTQYEDLLVFSTGIEELKGLIGRAKAPGASFADKLGGEAVKRLVTGKSQSGLALNLPPLLAFLGAAVGTDSTEQAVLTNLSSLFGVGVLSGSYDKSLLTFTGEVTLK